MKLIIIIIIFFINLQSLTKADDIRDFEIEGMSIGDSALDYFNNNELKKATDESAKDRKYIVKSFFNKEWILYEAIQIS